MICLYFSITQCHRNECNIFGETNMAYSILLFTPIHVGLVQYSAQYCMQYCRKRLCHVRDIPGCYSIFIHICILLLHLSGTFNTHIFIYLFFRWTSPWTPTNKRISKSMLNSRIVSEQTWRGALSCCEVVLRGPWYHTLSLSSTTTTVTIQRGLSLSPSQTSGSSGGIRGWLLLCTCPVFVVGDTVGCWLIRGSFRVAAPQGETGVPTAGARGDGICPLSWWEGWWVAEGKCSPP